MKLKDSYGRPLLNLRLAVTQRCNLQCLYCHREGEERHTERTEREMTVDEIARIVRIAVDAGISKVKLTGGEPLMRKDILEIVENISSIPGLQDLSMTTNGILLPSLADKLHSKGLKRVNVNVPLLNEEFYNKLTGGMLEEALEGVHAAVEAGLHPVKLNMLILKDTTENHVQQMIEFASKTGTILQLIELEPINISSEYYLAHHKLLDQYEKMLVQKAEKVETRTYMQNRRIYHLPDVTVEIVHPIENTEFCMHCTRLRVTSDGKMKPCLMRSDNLIDILTPMRKGASNNELTELFMLANQNRQPYNKNK